MRDTTMIRLDGGKNWLQPVRRIISPNQDDRPHGCEICLIVIHGISLPPGEFGTPYIDQLFTNTLAVSSHPYFREIEDQAVSSHLFINRGGEITQYVPFARRAWHAGRSEFNGRQNCNDFSIGIELEGTDDVPYEPAQYDMLAAVIKALQSAWPMIVNNNIKGHCHIAPHRKTDPGPAFNWKRLAYLLQ